MGKKRKVKIPLYPLGKLFEYTTDRFEITFQTITIKRVIAWGNKYYTL